METITVVKNWYTIKVQSNRERSVSEKLKQEMMRDFKEEINVLIPSQNTSIMKNGKVKKREQLLYPGYIFVETESVDKVLHFVKIINGMTSVLKDPQGNPIIMRQSEIERMTGEIQERKAIDKGLYAIGEEVNVINGPFASFRGKIQTIDYEKDKVKIEVTIFGRATIVDLTLADISK
jgi:transcriptional antiterminator NusG